MDAPGTMDNTVQEFLAKLQWLCDAFINVDFNNSNGLSLPTYRSVGYNLYDRNDFPALSEISHNPEYDINDRNDFPSLPEAHQNVESEDNLEDKNELPYLCETCQNDQAGNDCVCETCQNEVPWLCDACLYIEEHSFNDSESEFLAVPGTSQNVQQRYDLNDINEFPPLFTTICRFYLRGMCKFGKRCRYLHREIPPFYIEEEFGPRARSSKEAIELVKKARSEEKTCGICLDIILEKDDKFGQLFGILPNCNHCFCFQCINAWRECEEYEEDVTQACPQCRIISEHVYASEYWIEDKEEKQSFLNDGINEVISCHHLMMGGMCPFGHNCKEKLHVTVSVEGNMFRW